MEAPSSAPSKTGDYGTRRNTRSTSNQEKDNADNSKNGSSGSNTAKDQDLSNAEMPKKKQSERVVRAPNGDVLEYTTEDDITYKPLDSAYLNTERPDSPYFICIIQEIKVSKRDNAIVSVKWYYRPTEVPDLVYQMLVKDRYNQVVDPAVKELVMKPDVLNRELFVDDRMEATDTYPISCLRGKCDVTQYTSISDIKNFELRPDHFFSIYTYSPDTRRLATSKGETRVGPSHQWNASMRGIFQKADVPDLLKSPDHEDYDVKGRVYEEMTWEPKVNKCDLIMCLRAARSLAAFAGVCDGVTPEEGCIVASRDDTTINALRVLFMNNGNPRKAIDALVKNPVPVTIESKWTEEQVKRFQKGLKMYGKNFFKIRKELLPMKATGELVEFYYLWKKTQDNFIIRPNHGKHKRQAALKKSGKQKTNSGNGSGDQTSTEEEMEESEESEKEMNNSKKCNHCEISTSKDWFVGGKDSVMLCTDCRIFFKKYGENRPVIKVEDIDSANETDIDTPPAAKSQVPPFLFKPIKEEKVNNLIPRKPAKSLAKVNTPTEIKVRAEKPSKRQWSDSEIKVKQEVLPAKLKRPKTEPEEADNHSQTNQDASHPSSGISNPEATKDGDDPIEQKPFSAPTSLTSSLLPTKAIHPQSSDPVTHIPSKNIIPNAESISQDASKRPIPQYETKTATLTPFVSASQGPHPHSGKPSELEAISKLAFNTGLMSRSMCSTVVGYVGNRTPPTLPSSIPSAGQTTSTFSLSGATTVTMTSTIRSSPTAEPSGSSSSSNLPNPSTEPSRLPPREALPVRDPHLGNPRSIDPAYHPSSRLSPQPPRTDTEKEKPGQYQRPKVPSTSTIRNPRFPFDPCVTDQIISNANMSRPTVKEEVRSLSPSRQPEGRRLIHPHMGPVRSSPVPHHQIKQESYQGHINPQSGRPYLSSETVPHPSYGGHPRTHAQSPISHGSLPMGSRHSASHPPVSHRPPIPTSRPSSPRQSYNVSGSIHPPPSQVVDSDVEVIGESHTHGENLIECKEPASFGNSAKFIKTWDRGSNSCFRTDYIYAPDESSIRKRVEKQKEYRKEHPQTSAAPSQDSSKPPPPKRPRTPSHNRPSSDQERKREERTESSDRSRREGPGPLPASSLPPQVHRSTPGHGSVPMTTRTPTTIYDPHHRPTPVPFVSPLGSLGSNTPALRQLQQYAAIDRRLNAEAAMESVHPLYPYYNLAGAENELRERERLAKLAADIKQDPLDPHNPNIHQIAPAGIPIGAIPASIAGQQFAMEQQLHLRHYQAQILSSLPPGANPQSALALAAAQIPHGMINPEAYAAERMSAERLQAERLLAAEQQYQLELLHHHSHSHVHSHLHLHPPGQPGGPPAPATPLPLALQAPPPGLAVSDPYAAAAAIQAINNPFAASAGNPMLNPMLRNQQAAAAQAALMHQGLAAGPHLQAAAAAAAREHAPQPHPFTQHLQAVHEQHVIDQRRAAALQEQQFLAARFKP